MNFRGLTESEKRSFQSKVNNHLGGLFEARLKIACDFYRQNQIAKIEKIAEPFKVLKTKRNGRFEGIFTANAEPDFQGTLCGGYSIVFESKYTTTDTFKLSVLSEKQKESLKKHLELGAYVYVAVGIQERYFFIPFEFLREKEREKKKSFKADDLKEFEVYAHSGVGIDFLKREFNL